MYQFGKVASFLLLTTFISCTAAASDCSCELKKGLSKFSTELYQKCIISTDSNVIVSPYSIATAAALLSQGANGKTFEEIISALNLPDNRTAVAELFHKLSTDFEENKEDVILNVANRIYVQQGVNVRSDFNYVATTKFGAVAEPIDFSESVDSSTKINKWVENSTNSKIKDLIGADMLTENTRMVLVNVIYFKALWKTPFYRTRTALGKFYVSDKETTDVQYMHVFKAFMYGVLDDLDATAVEFPYENTEVSLIVILPNKRNGLTELEGKLRDYDVAKINGQLNGAGVDVTLPKFKIEHKVNLNDVFQKMGMTTMYSHTADFSRLLESKEPLTVSDVVHQAFIEVTEEGTEAAAGTASMVSFRSGTSYSKTFNFTVDHPFLFSINKNNVPLFIGRVNRL